jgi:hypothetical protein
MDDFEIELEESLSPEEQAKVRADWEAGDPGFWDAHWQEMREDEARVKARCDLAFKHRARASVILW